jgi:5,5'-dehydrodivanillate O-demethylase
MATVRLGSRSVSRSDDLSQTGPGSAAGDYLRRFWQPVYHSADLTPGRAVPLMILGEHFTLYRGESGRLCLTDPRCPHRGTQLSSGWVEGDDLRCFYHGWKFGPDGRCNEQPAEDSSYCDRIRLNSYPMREYLGLIFAYLGPGVAPHFPTYPEFEDFDGLIEIDSYLRECNYYQNLENALDMSHVAFVHRDNMVSYTGIGRGAQLRAEESDWGVTYTFTRHDGQLRVQQFGMPNIFYMTALPTDSEVGWQESLFWWVPIDDRSHMQFSLHRVSVPGAAAQEVEARHQKRRAAIDLPHQRVAEDILRGKIALRDIDKSRVDLVRLQDDIAQLGQGRVADRDAERPGRGDTGVIAIRRLWSRELAALAEGRALKDWTRDATIVPKAWGLSGTHRTPDGNATPRTALTDIRPQVEIALQLDALHSNPIDN